LSFAAGTVQVKESGAARQVYPLPRDILRRYGFILDS
jgi:hypothetical protein